MTGDEVISVYPVDAGGFVASLGGQWIPGVYASEGDAERSAKLYGADLDEWAATYSHLIDDEPTP